VTHMGLLSTPGSRISNQGFLPLLQPRLHRGQHLKDFHLTIHLEDPALREEVHHHTEQHPKFPLGVQQLEELRAFFSFLSPQYVIPYPSYKCLAKSFREDCVRTFESPISPDTTKKNIITLRQFNRRMGRTSTQEGGS
jgi:hypothetical protein